MVSSVTTPFPVTLRKDFLEYEHCGGYRSLRLHARFLDVGEWSITLPLEHVASRKLMVGYAAGDDLARWGIVARQPGSADVILSGSATECYVSERSPGSTSTVTLVGQCDNAILNDEVAWPAPAADVSTTAVTTLAAARDVRTGAAETVLLAYLAANIGPAAGIVRRQYPWLQLPASQGRGTSGTWRPRFDYLIDLAESIARRGGIGYRVVQGAPGQATVQVWVPTLHAEARFSTTSRTLQSAELTWRAAETTEVILAADSEAEARKFLRRTAAGSYARRRVQYVDKRNTPDLADLQAEGDEMLAEAAAVAGIRFEPVDAGLKYGVDYQLGGRVIAVVAGHDITETITEAVITHEAGQPVRTQVSIGLPDPQETPEADKRIRRLARDLGTVTRR